ncbi:MAG: Bug family tripartite tricarboxylate transporter substrate binding protein [Bordetella sp.]|uniref:Bug family tripartite tricarboxylate transporter substrate binding protein n=1 Tax=Bordetella sp. TaxID=28081 RepID=UPI003F7C8482
MKHRYWIAALAACAVLPLAAAGATLDWPSDRIDWIVGFAPGGTSDVLTRIAAKELSRRTGKAVIVENKTGASGAIALQYVAHAAPSAGLLLTVPGPLIYPAPEPELGKDLQPVALLADGPMVIVGPASSAKPSIQAIVDDARAHPGAWSFASSGIGTSQHLAGELLNQMAGTHIVHVPYKGGGQAVTDVIGGQIPLAILGPTPVMAGIRSHRLKAYAVTTTYRLPSLPDVPTMQQAGFPGYDASQWMSVAATPGIPAKDLDELNGLLQDIIKTPEFQAALENAGMIAQPGNRQALLDFVTQDSAKWKTLIQQAGIKLTQ